MIEYSITCDRCGKKVAQKDFAIISFCRRNVNTVDRSVAQGDVCEECHKDFIELAETFFDELNKGGRG